MKIFYFIMLCMFPFIAYSQSVSKEKDRKELNVLVSPEEKDLSLLLLNEKMFLVTMKDVKDIGQKDIKSIQMHLPGTSSYDSFVNDYKSAYPHIQVVFEIVTQEGAVLPEKFQKGNK